MAEPIPLRDKLYGNPEELRRTAAFERTSVSDDEEDQSDRTTKTSLER